MRINLKFQIFSFKVEKGFTLVELLIVISIIGLLAAFLMSNFIGVRQRSRDAQRKADIKQIQTALELYRSDLQTYPASLNCGSSLSGGSPSITYMSRIPCDPVTAASYTYTRGGGGSTYTLRACLENANDPQKDTTNTCSGSTVSHTVTQL